MFFCGGRRVKTSDLRPEEKWDFISLNDFKSNSCLQHLAYGWLYFTLLLSIAVYGVDTFTAVNLLAFNKWSSEIKPFVSVDISKWIFSVCIILSWVNLVYEYIRAIQVIKRGAVAESYLDSLAVRLQSIRPGRNGRGFRRFLVFAELTKSKKGAEYFALFAYFSFQSWIRVIFCSGPRQVVNALTLWSVFTAQLEGDSTDAGTFLLQFFDNLGVLADQNKQQVVVLSGMLFTLTIWVINVLSLLSAFLVYIFFLWHFIPTRDGGLAGYCERKINTRLKTIVSAKVNKALEEEERKRIRMERKATKNGEKVPVGRQATLPTLFDAKDDKLPPMPILNRNDTTTTLPAYSSRPGTPGSQVPTIPSFELDNLAQKRPFPQRNITNASYATNAPLLEQAGEMGYDGPPTPPEPTVPQMDNRNFAPPQRAMTGSTMNSQYQRGPAPNRYPTNGRPGPPTRNLTGQTLVGNDYFGNQSPYGEMPMTSTPAPMNGQRPGPPGSNGNYGDMPMTSTPGPMNQRPQPGSMDSYGRPMPRADMDGRSISGAPSMGRRTPFGEMNGRSSPAPSGPPPRTQTPLAEMDGGWTPGPSQMMRQATFNDANGRSSPAPGPQFGGRNGPAPNMQGRASPAPGPGPMRAPTAPPATSNGYVAFNPAMRSASAAPGPQSPAMQPPQRNMTAPIQQQYQQDYSNSQPPPPQRVGTAQSQRGPGPNQYAAYPGGDVEAQRGPPGRIGNDSPASFNRGPQGQNQNGYRGQPQNGYQGQSQNPYQGYQGY